MTGPSYMRTHQFTGQRGEEPRKSESTSTVPIGADEIDDDLDFEARIHQLAGWSVDGGPEDGFVVAAKVRRDGALVVRVIYPVTSDPASDGDPDRKWWHPILDRFGDFGAAGGGAS